MAWPDFDIRAPSVTWGKRDSTMAGDMAMESSSVTLTGRSLTFLRAIASGMRGPLTARAKINTVSSGAALSASAASSVTLTSILPPAAVAVSEPLDTSVAGDAVSPSPPILARAICICWLMAAASSSLPGGSCWATCCQFSIAPWLSPRWYFQCPISHRPLMLSGCCCSAVCNSRPTSSLNLPPLAVTSMSAWSINRSGWSPASRRACS